jgi:hypothetical protein
MFWLILIVFIGLLAGGISVIAKWDYEREYRYLLPLIPILVAIWALGLYAYNRGLDYQVGKCAKWSVETNYETKYVNIGYADWACYGLVNNNWVPIERIRGIENE